MPAPPPVQVRLLGGFALTVDGEPVADDGWRLRKAKTLVKLLVLAPQRRLHREQAIDVLWPDRAPAAAANNLHQALHVARRQLGGGDRLRLDDDMLALCPGEPLVVDSETFRDRAVTALRSGDRHAARAALGLYAGPLLPEDLYEDWTDPARAEAERLHEELEALAGGAHREQRDNLPSELTAFIGREAELTDIAQLLRRGPLLTIAGPAGCGKTRLAVETAARRRDDFVDGVWLVELAPLSRPEMVADAVAAVFGLKLRRRTAETALVETLASREALIVLDNCEHLVGACAQLAEALLRGCPALQVLATSREALQVNGEVVWRVPSLSDAEAVHLFTDRASAAQPGFALTSANSAAVSEICRRLDGVPLAIELAAARVGSLPPGEIAHRLDRSFRLLRQGQRTSVTRQQTLEAALDWSYQLLDADEAMLLRRLAVFAGGFGLDAAEGIGADDDLPAGEIVDALVRLVGKSLVVAEEVAGPPRYRLLEMVRQYARERLGDAGEAETMLERHARWYEALATDLTGGARLARLDSETDNLRAALRWLLYRDAPAALQLALALGDWWLLRGRLAEAREWFDASIDRAPPETAATALLRAVPFAVRSGDMAEGGRLAERSLAIHRESGDRPGASQALQMLGLQSWLRGSYERSRDLLDEAIDEARIGRSTVAEANASHALGLLTISTGDLDHARALLERAVELLERSPGGTHAAFLVATPGLVPLADAAGFVQEESQIMFRPIDGPRTAAAYVRISLAVVARLEGDEAGAQAGLRNVLATLRAAGDEAGKAQALAAIGRLRTVTGEVDRAGEALRESLAIRERLGDVRSISLSLALLAELSADGDDAGALLERALTLVGQAGDRPAVMWMLWALARVDLHAGRTDSARERLETSLSVAESLSTRIMRAWTLSALAEVDLHAGADAHALELLDEAQSEFMTVGDAWGIARCMALRGR